MSDRLKAIEEKRAALQAKVASAEDEQLAIDLEAIFELEQTQRVGLVKMAFVEAGTPVRAAVRAARPAEVKRFRARVKSDKHGKIDAQAANDAANELGITCQLYPEPKSEADERMRETHAQADAALGLLALKLAGAEEVEEGKE
jgi:hypothetical protein